MVVCQDGALFAVVDRIGVSSVFTSDSLLKFMLLDFGYVQLE